MQSPTLNTQMKKSLRGVAHHLDPIIAVSERGISDGIVEETERALSDHELIKVKVFSADRSSRGEVASALAEATSSIVLQQIGKVAVLYRHNPKANPKLSNIARYLDQSDF
ncbi:MAG: ribosome assembly RNA-binding protein YhbY [Gammaproteobacteria bacterium]|nr:ribosome assembly RNA-binding protein YhbY [Gammaproteobacteria bacterium]